MTDEHIGAHPVRISPRTSGQQAASDRDYSAEEEAQIMSRLRDLGYMN